MKIKCIIDSKPFTSKPVGFEVGGIIKRMTIDKAKEYSVEDIKKSLLLGNTVRPSNCGGKIDSWISQQMFMIDVDDNLTIEQVIEICKKKELIPNFIYTSFSHTEEHHKFRLVFILDKPIAEHDIAKKIQLFLMDSIGGVDEQCKNLNRIYYAGKSIVFDSGNVFNTDRLIKLSKDIVLEVKAVKQSNSKGKTPVLKSEKAIVPMKVNNIDYIRNLDVEGLQCSIFSNYDTGRKGGLIEKYNKHYSINPPKTPSQIVTNRNELYKAIGQVNLIEFLGLESDKFNCIMHEDNNPSAGIFIGDDGNYIYKCFSSKCGFVGGIVRIVERLAKCNKPKAINFIKAVYGIELIESEWQKQQKEILQANIDYLMSNQMQEEYPELYKRIKNYTPILIVLHNLAMNHVKDENIADMNDVVFYSSLSNIKQESKNNSGKVSDRINLFAFLELISKLDEKDIPDHLLRRAKHEAAKKKQKNLVNYYSIPSYSDEQLLIADDMAKLFKDSNMTMKGWSRELLLRTFGQELADKVYPQFKQVKISKASEEFEKIFTRVLFDLIDKQGYATEKQCLDSMQGYKELNHVKIKKMLQEVLDKYDLDRVRANKEIKEKYNMDTAGYPFIIVKNS